MDTKTRPLYTLLIRDPPQNKGHIQTESEGLEKVIPHSFEPVKYFSQEPDMKGMLRLKIWFLAAVQQKISVLFYSI